MRLTLPAAAKRFIHSLIWHAAPPLSAALASSKISPPSAERVSTWAMLPLPTLIKAISDEWERAKALDEKLTKTTAALSIAGAVGGAASGPLLDGLAATYLKTAVFCLLVFCIISLFSGIMMGFAGLRPKPRGGVGPDFAVATREESTAAVEHCVDALALFETSNIKRANEAAAANAAIRNGILSFVMATLLAMFAPRASEKDIGESCKGNADFLICDAMPEVFREQCPAPWALSRDCGAS